MLPIYGVRRSRLGKAEHFSKDGVCPCGDAVAQPTLPHRDLAAELVSLARLLLEYSVAPRLECRETLVEDPGDPAVEPYGPARPRERFMSARATLECRRHAIAPPAKTEFAADSALEETGFEPLVPLRSHNRDTGPMSPIRSNRVALVIPLANSI